MLALIGGTVIWGYTFVPVQKAGTPLGVTAAFVGVALAITAFPMLARIITEESVSPPHHWPDCVRRLSDILPPSRNTRLFLVDVFSATDASRESHVQAIVVSRKSPVRPS